jgi:hypothetical protein
MLQNICTGFTKLGYNVDIDTSLIMLWELKDITSSDNQDIQCRKATITDLEDIIKVFAVASDFGDTYWPTYRIRLK